MKKATFGLILVLAIFGPAISLTQAATPIVIKLATVQNEQHVYAIMSFKMKEDIERLTNGGIILELYHNAALGDERAILEGMQFGTIGMGITTSGSAGNFMPDVTVFEMPFLFDSVEQARKTVDGPVGQNILSMFDKVGLKGLAYAEQGFRNLTNSRRPVKTVADVAGLKIRVMENELAIDLFNALGANAIPMQWGECMTALQQKTIDGQENPLTTIYTFNLHESQNYLTLTRHTYSAAVILMDINLWQSLTAEYQKILQDVIVDAVAMGRNYLDEQDAKYLIGVRERGMEVIEPDLASFRSRIGPVTEKYGKRFVSHLEAMAHEK